MTATPSADTLRILGVAALSLGAVSRPPTLAATAALVGLALFAWSLRGDRPSSDPYPHRWAGLAMVLVLLARFSISVGPLNDAELAARPYWVAFLLLSAGSAVLAGDRSIGRTVSIIAALSAVVIVTVTMTVAEWDSPFGFDVYQMHESAGRAIFNGENPYTDAVTVANGSPFAPEGAVIEGYPYTPPVVVTYAVAAQLGDPRIISSICWLMVLLWLSWLTRRPDRVGRLSFGLLILLAGLAVWPVVWFASWTEPLSLGLFLGTALLWRRHPTASAVFLGLAIASKQFFIFLAPLLLLHREARRSHRLVVAAATGLAAVLVGVLPDPIAFYRATILNLTEIGFRTDSQSVSGLLAENGIHLFLPSWLWIALGLSAGAMIARHSQGPASFFARGGLTLGFVFLIGQSFPNYWFLVVGLLSIAAVTLAQQETNDGGGRLAEATTAPLS